MTERDQLRAEFIKNTNFTSYIITPIPGDLSSRRYFRITKEGSDSLILMDAPLEERTKEFCLMTDYLAENGFSVPRILERDLQHGFLVIEDFGNRKVNEILSGKIIFEGSEDLTEERVYKRSIEVLAHLHDCPIPSFLSEPDDESLVAEARRIIEWYIEPLNGQELSSDMKNQFDDLIRLSLKQAKLFPNVVTLRDYHVDNLFWLEDRMSIARLGLIDYQDAELLSPAYDLVSILEDVRREVSFDLGQKMLAYYLSLKPNLDRKDMMTAYHIFGAQRNIKIIGIFAMRAATQNKGYLLTMLPRVLGYLYHDLNHPLLFNLKRWFDEAIPRQQVVTGRTYGGLTKIWLEN